MIRRRHILPIVIGGLLASCATGAEKDAKAEAAELCGGIAGLSCDEGEFCSMDTGACRDVADAAGLCKPKPDVCTLEFNPVCGCDGQTHANPCAAAAAGVSIASFGVCDS